jgi:hypothetical protein
MSAPDRQWRIRFVDDLDDELVDWTAAFFEEHFPGVFGETCDPELFRWKLGPSNPAGPGILAVAVADDTIAGVMSATMRRMVIGTRSVDGSFTGDTFTHPDFRRSGSAAETSPGTTADHYLNRSVFGRLVNEVSQALVDRAVEIVYSTPNDQSRPGYCRRGAFEVAATASGLSWHCPQSSLFADRLPGQIGRVAFTAFDALRSASRRRLETGEPMTIIPLRRDTPTPIFETIDRLWRSRPSGPNVVLVQDGDWIRHRYALHPSQSYDLHLVGETERPGAFAISRPITRSHGATTRCLAEWSLNLSTDRRRLSDLLSMVVDNARDVDTVSAWTDHRPGTWMRMVRAGFIPINSVPVVLGCNDLGRQIIDRAISFPLSIGWSDNV